MVQGACILLSARARELFRGATGLSRAGEVSTPRKIPRGAGTILARTVLVAPAHTGCGAPGLQIPSNIARRTSRSDFSPIDTFFADDTAARAACSRTRAKPPSSSAQRNFLHAGVKASSNSTVNSASCVALACCSRICASHRSRDVCAHLASTSAYGIAPSISLSRYEIDIAAPALNEQYAIRLPLSSSVLVGVRDPRAFCTASEDRPIEMTAHVSSFDLLTLDWFFRHLLQATQAVWVA